jgi:hypothetical protein
MQLGGRTSFYKVKAWKLAATTPSRVHSILQDNCVLWLRSLLEVMIYGQTAVAFHSPEDVAFLYNTRCVDRTGISS